MRTRLLPLVLAISTPAWAEAPPPLSVDVIELTVTGAGGIDIFAIHRATTAVHELVKQCYASATERKLPGALAISFTLDTAGKVSNVAATGIASMNACLIAGIKAASFDGTENGRVDIHEKLRLSLLRSAAAVGSGPAFASLTGAGDASGGLDDTSVYGGLPESAANSSGGIGLGTTGATGAVGYGGFGSAHGGAPSIAIGQPDVQGNLDKAIIRRYIKRAAQKLQYCYERQLINAPRLSGTVTAQFTIRTDGTVANTIAGGVHSTELNTCIARVIDAIEFPKPKGGEVKVAYPLVFSTGQSRSAAPGKRQ